MGVAVDCANGMVYISEYAGLRATWLDGSLAWYRALNGGWGLAVDSRTGNVYVSQYGGNTVLVYNRQGTLVRTIGSNLRGKSGRLGCFYGPAGLTLTNGRLVVADPDSNRFQVLGLDGSFQAVYGRKGSANGQFGGSKIGPFGVAAHDASSRLYLADPYLSRISVWSLNGRDATFLFHMGSSGRGTGQLFYPFGLSVHQASGQVYVLNTNLHRVDVFDASGTYQRALGAVRSQQQCNMSPGGGGETLFPLSARPSFKEQSSFTGRIHVAGVAFTTRTAGYVTGIRYIEPGGDLRTHTAKIWDSSRTLLHNQTVNIDGCATGDWVNVTFDRPVYLSAGSTYVASIDNLYAYAATPNGFGSARTGGSIYVSGSSAGRHALTTSMTSGYPSDPASATNYWVDVDFYSEANYRAAPKADAQFQFPYAGAFGGDGRLYVGSGAVQPSVNSKCGQWPSDPDVSTIFTPSEGPQALDLSEAVAYSVGVRFKVAVSGLITNFRFFKAASEPGTGHVGKIYDWNANTLLATTVAFNDIGCRGPNWVSAPLNSPLSVTPGIEYMAVLDNVTYYVKSNDYLADPKTNGDLTTVASGSTTGLAGLMPKSTYWGAANYWVDVEFTPLQPKPHVPTPAPEGSLVFASCNSWPGGAIQTVFGASEPPPSMPDDTSGSRHALGLRFSASVTGDVRGVRFLKGLSEGGTGHVIRVINFDNGALLASVTNLDDSLCAGGQWVSAPLASPLRISPGTTYLAFVDSTLFHPKTIGGFSSSRTSGYLTALGSTSGSAGYTPWDSYWGTDNYFLDVEFDPVVPPTTAPTLAPTPQPIAPVPAGCSVWPGAGYQTVFSAADQPGQMDLTDGRVLVLGHRFTTTATGTITAVRFFKSAREGAAGHVGKIYDWVSGNVLAQTAAFADGPCQGSAGWVRAALSPALRVEAGVEYLMAVGDLMYYVKSEEALAEGRTSGNLRVDAGPARFSTTPGGIPREFYGANSNYFVDLEFTTQSLSSSSSSSCNSWPSSGSSTVFTTSDKPTYPDLSDGRGLVLGHRFTTKVAGFITAVRFYKANSEGGGGHVGKIYDWNSGALLASTDSFEDYSCQGGRWVSMPLQSPLQTSAGGEYLVAMDSLLYYVKSDGAMVADRVSSASLVMRGGGATYGSPGAMPREVYGPSNVACYFIDVEFGTSSSQQGRDTTTSTCGAWPSSAYQTVFSSADTPVYLDSTDGKALVLGHRFTTKAAGSITAVRFFKANSEGGSGHVGKIYDWNSGALLGSTDAIADGQCGGGKWVSASLQSAVQASAGGVYLVAMDSLLYYVKSDGAMAADRTGGSLVMRGGGATYGSPGAMPREVYGPSNVACYFIDVEFLPSSSSSVPSNAPYWCNVWPTGSTQTIYSAADTPAEPSSTDGSKYALGLRLSTSVAGDITAVRFLRAAGEAGTGHVVQVMDWNTGALYTTLDASGIDTSSCAAGSWVSLRLTPPLRTAVGTTYLVYVDGFTYYARQNGFFASARTSGSLTAYGSTSGVTGYVPWSDYWAATGYFLDVEFTPGTMSASALSITSVAAVSPTRASAAQTPAPTDAPAAGPTPLPTTGPTVRPSLPPTKSPTAAPTARPSTPPTMGPTLKPSLPPTPSPTVLPTPAPTAPPTLAPTPLPTDAPTARPTLPPTNPPTAAPTAPPSPAPTAQPTDAPTVRPSLPPTELPTVGPTPLLGRLSSLTQAPSAPVSTAAPTAGPAVVVCGTFPVRPWQTIYNSDDTPMWFRLTDGEPLAFGLRFAAYRPGVVRAVRFYKALGEGGIGHSGRIYGGKSGQLLASTGSNVVDTRCPGPQWVSLYLSSPLNVTANTEYVAVVDNVTTYVKSERSLGAARISGDLIALMNGAVFGPPGSVPREAPSGVGVNYFIDVEFTR